MQCGVNSYTQTSTAPSTRLLSPISHTTSDWTVENLLSYDRTINKSQINALALYSTEKTQFYQTAISGIGIPADALQYYNIGTASQEIDVLPQNQLYNERGLLSWNGTPDA